MVCAEGFEPPSVLYGQPGYSRVQPTVSASHTKMEERARVRLADRPWGRSSRFKRGGLGTCPISPKWR